MLQRVPGSFSRCPLRCPPKIPFIERGTAAFRRTNPAFLCAGFSTFALLYCVQSLLPAFSEGFHVSLAQPLVLGLALLTFGFFGAHSLASSRVGRRAATARAQASSLYLFSYDMGAAVMGALGGLARSAAVWPGILAVVGGGPVVALLVALRLARLPGPG